MAGRAAQRCGGPSTAPPAGLTACAVLEEKRKARRMEAVTKLRNPEMKHDERATAPMNLENIAHEAGPFQSDLQCIRTKLHLEAVS